LRRHEGLEVQNARGSHFFKVAANYPGFDPDLSALLSGQLVHKYSILMSITIFKLEKKYYRYSFNSFRLQSATDLNQNSIHLEKSHIA